MSFTLTILGVSLVVLLGTLMTLELGRKLGRRERLRATEAPSGLGLIEGAVFTLLGLLLAFTFSGAATRFDQRRELVAREANAIGTAWLRLDLLPEGDQGDLRQLYREYLDARLESFRNSSDRPSTDRARARATSLQDEIWSKEAAACTKAPPSYVCLLVLPAVNEMIDITTTRLVATWTHPPPTIYLLLIALCFAAAVLSGYATASNARRSWVHQLMFAGSIAISIYIILELEYPRFGLIRVDAVDQVLIDLRQSFGDDRRH